MNLLITNGTLYVDNFFLCYCEAGNGRDSLPVGRFPLETRYSHAHGEDLPHVEHVGWIGPSSRADVSCDVVLGRVRGSDGTLPCRSFVGRILAMLAVAEDDGKSSAVVIEP